MKRFEGELSCLVGISKFLTTEVLTKNIIETSIVLLSKRIDQLIIQDSRSISARRKKSRGATFCEHTHAQLKKTI